MKLIIMLNKKNKLFIFFTLISCFSSFMCINAHGACVANLGGCSEVDAVACDMFIEKFYALKTCDEVDPKGSCVDSFWGTCSVVRKSQCHTDPTVTFTTGATCP